jgi:hypothetical protein
MLGSSPYEVGPAELAQRAASKCFGYLEGAVDDGIPFPLTNLLNIVGRMGQPTDGLESVPSPDSRGFDYLLLDVSADAVLAFRELVGIPGVVLATDSLVDVPHPFDVEPVWRHGGSVRWLTPWRGVHCSVRCTTQPHWQRATLSLIDPPYPNPGQ